MALSEYTKRMSSESEVLFIAEVSANHLGSLDRAKEIVRQAAISGASAVKFQTYTADTMTLNLDDFSVSSEHQLWGGKNLFQLYQEAHTPWEWHAELFDHARYLGLIPFSSPFDLTAVEFLEALDAPMYKIASLETGDLQLIQAVAETGKPIIISTGATEWSEVADAVDTVFKTGNKNLTLLVCTSSYPSLPIHAHLRRIETLKKSFDCKVGLSDHTLGIGVSVAAIALGAVAIEKHLTLSRLDGGADGAFSMEPNEFANLVQAGNDAFHALGSSEWKIQEAERESRRLRRSLYVTSSVKAGDVATLDNIRSIRPGEGLQPKFLPDVLGRKFNRSVSKGTPLSFELFE